jgi:spermidine/putrescine-binding protein
VDIDELIDECKIGLGISTNSNAFDGLLRQKINVIQSFMKRAGVSEAMISGDLAIGVTVMGVADIWEQNGGEVRFSPVFNTMLTQLTYPDGNT